MKGFTVERKAKLVGCLTEAEAGFRAEIVTPADVKIKLTRVTRETTVIDSKWGLYFHSIFSPCHIVHIVGIERLGTTRKVCKRSERKPGACGREHPNVQVTGGDGGGVCKEL